MEDIAMNTEELLFTNISGPYTNYLDLRLGLIQYWNPYTAEAYLMISARVKYKGGYNGYSSIYVSTSSMDVTINGQSIRKTGSSKMLFENQSETIHYVNTLEEGIDLSSNVDITVSLKLDSTVANCSTKMKIEHGALYNFYPEDKQALQDGTAAIRCKLVVKATNELPEIVLSDDDFVKDWTYTDERYVPQQGFIGQFVARTLSGNLQNVDADFSIEGREIELILGVAKIGELFSYITTEDGLALITESGQYMVLSKLGGEDVTWYSFGNFIVTNPEDNEVSDNTKFEAMDYAKLFNKPFDKDYKPNAYWTSFSELVYQKDDGTWEGSVTASWLANYVCAQVGVEMGHDDFTNSDFLITNNPFQAGESCRDVMKTIAQLAFSWVRIDWDNKCYIDFGNSVSTFADEKYNIIDNNQYYSLETKKESYGPINRVVIGMKNVDGENLIVANDTDSIQEHGLHTLYIYDNPLTNTRDTRNLILNNHSAEKLLGLQYTHLNTKTIGHPWLKGNENLTIIDMDNKPRKAFAFNRTMDYNGHIKTTIDSMGESSVEETLVYESEVYKSVRDAQLSVSKADGRITALASDINEVSGKVSKVEASFTSQEASIKILSTYINEENGEITEVKTSNGFTFNKDGLNIYTSEDTFNTQINNTGTRYKDGDKIVVETTKDGSTLVNISEKGTHNMSYDERYDKYNLSEERIETDGEYAYALFYNGEE